MQDAICKRLYSPMEVRDIQVENFGKKTRILRISPARYLQSNGMVEGHIQTVKRILKKAKFDNKDPY